MGSSPTSAASPRPRVSRAEGMENMVAATIRLVQERKPEQITVRDVGAAAGHHHRFVQAWFGSKQGLFRAAFDRMIEDTARNVQRPFSPRVDLLARAKATAELMNWLLANDPDSLSGPRPMPVIDRVTEIYHEDFGMDIELARLMSVRLVATTSAALLFSGPLGLQPGDIAALTQLEIEIGHLLAEARRGGNSAATTNVRTKPSGSTSDVSAVPFAPLHGSRRP